MKGLPNLYHFHLPGPPQVTLTLGPAGSSMVLGQCQSLVLYLFIVFQIWILSYLILRRKLGCGISIPYHLPGPPKVTLTLAPAWSSQVIGQSKHYCLNPRARLDGPWPDQTAPNCMFWHIVHYSPPFSAGHNAGHWTADGPRVWGERWSPRNLEVLAFQPVPPLPAPLTAFSLSCAVCGAESLQVIFWDQHPRCQIVLE